MFSASYSLVASRVPDRLRLCKGRIPFQNLAGHCLCITHITLYHNQKRFGNRGSGAEGKPPTELNAEQERLRPEAQFEEPRLMR